MEVQSESKIKILGQNQFFGEYIRPLSPKTKIWHDNPVSRKFGKYSFLKKNLKLFRHGPGAMATSAVVGGILLGMIEGLGILMNKWQSESYRPVDPRMAPQDPSLLGPDPSGNKSFQ